LDLTNKKRRKTMSLLSLYHALGIYGYHHLKTESQEGAIFLYMVWAGIVKHPSEWEYSGYHELHNIPERKRKKYILTGTISTLKLAD